MPGAFIFNYLDIQVFHYGIARTYLSVVSTFSSYSWFKAISSSLYSKSKSSSPTKPKAKNDAKFVLCIYFLRIWRYEGLLTRIVNKVAEVIFQIFNNQSFWLVPARWCWKPRQCACFQFLQSSAHNYCTVAQCRTVVVLTSFTSVTNLQACRKNPSNKRSTLLKTLH